ncbi:MAG: peptide chain release factor N(5)-glutamine methyltransferase, partial [Candidatus Krumholzibacteria bacterium]|nr:peptide chain release factor N(5)-glutamine methyltransferase [Candidatus Krumholzibacteria bacterium]
MRGEKTAQREGIGYLTIVEVLKKAEVYLGKRGIESARLNAEHLLARVMGCTRLDLYLRFDECPGEEALALYGDYLRKRARHFPLQYILGEVEFYSLPFHVREGVFIPRPETELLVEWIEEIVRQDSDVRFLEFGVGAGVISGALAARHPQWRGAAFDISSDVVSLARENFEALGVLERVWTFVADGFGAVGAGISFDILVANPPYIPTGAIPTLTEEVCRHETRAALDGGEDGVSFYPLLAEAGARLLNHGGLVALEIGDGQGRKVKEILRNSGFEHISVREDYNGMERMVTAIKS